MFGARCSVKDELAV